MNSNSLNYSKKAGVQLAPTSSAPPCLCKACLDIDRMVDGGAIKKQALSYWDRRRCLTTINRDLQGILFVGSVGHPNRQAGRLATDKGHLIKPGSVSIFFIG
jgi:hypothetical protein